MHVRTTHLHVVLSGTESPDRMMTQMKAWATRCLREAALIDNGTKPWARHGSTVPLRTPQAVEAACRYVVEGQGRLSAHLVATDLFSLSRRLRACSP